MTPKQKAWGWCSKYIRLRDAIAYQQQYPEVDLGWVKCCTCRRIVHIKKNADAGHFIGRGSMGASGVYFDERNIHTQCKRCNGFEQGNPIAYKEFMLDEYGQDTIDMLLFLNKNQSYKDKFEMMGLMYKQMYEGLIKGTTEPTKQVSLDR